MNYWIFQYNPIIYEQLDRIENCYRLPDWLNVNPFKHYQKMDTKDIIFIWKAKGGEDWRGIIAKTKILRKLGEVRDKDESWKDYTKDPEKMKEIIKQPYVDVEYENPYTRDPLKYQEIEDEFIKKGIELPLVMLQPYGITTCELTEEQGKCIEALLRKHNRD